MSPRDLLVFGEDWASHPSSTQHLMRCLGEHYRILWVNSIGLRRPRISGHDMRRIVSKVSAMLGKRTAERSHEDGLPGFRIVQPRALSWPGSRLAAAFNRRVLGRQLRQVMAEMGMHNPIVWTSLPSAVEVLEELNPQAVVYYCGDDFSALAGVDHRPVAAQEARLVARADLVLAASQTLAGRLPAEKTCCLPHGVDFARFADKNLPRPADLPAGKPIAGFYGGLNNWLDQALLSQVAQHLPDWNIVLIGPVQCDISTLLREPNVHYLGSKGHAELAAYVQHWQVSLLPFVDNAQIRACNPLKLREYLATGKPVVSTPFPAVQEHRGAVHLADSAEHFAQAIITAAVDAPAPGDAWLAHIDDWFSVHNLARAGEWRQSRVAKESWQQRAAAVHGLMQAL